MENIKETYDKLLEVGDLSNEKELTDVKLSDSEVHQISDTLNKVVEENANLKVIANLPSNNGVSEAKSDLVGEDKLVNIKINPATNEKAVIGTVEENDNNLSSELFEDIIDDKLDGVDIDNIELRKEVVEKTVNEKFNTQFNETEVIQLLNLLNEYRKDKNINIYNNLPKSIQRMIDNMIAKDGIPYNAIKNIKKTVSKEIIEELIFDASIDNYQIEFNEEIEKVFGGIKDEFRNMSIDMTKEQITRLINVEPELREKDPDKADKLLKIIDNMKNSFSYDNLYNAIKERRLGKIRKIDLEKPEKIYRKFNFLYQDSVYNIYDMNLLPDILRKVLPEDISNDSIHKFLISFCKYCEIEKLKPEIIEEHAFMYYTVLNIVLLSLGNNSVEDDEFSKEIITNITRIINLFN